MSERLYRSVKKLFEKEAPDLLKSLKSRDLFWTGIRNNTLKDGELDAISATMEELGLDASISDVAKAVQTIQQARQKGLPTPFDLQIKS